MNYNKSDTFDISKISLKQLLVRIETKEDLTEYLAKHTRIAMQCEGIEFSIIYAKITGATIPIIPLEIMNHDDEEADTVLILHALDVAKDNPYKEYFVLSTNTKVFLLLICYYQLLYHLAYFRIGTGER